MGQTCGPRRPGAWVDLLKPPHSQPVFPALRSPAGSVTQEDHRKTHETPGRGRSRTLRLPPAWHWIATHVVYDSTQSKRFNLETADQHNEPFLSMRLIGGKQQLSDLRVELHVEDLNLA